MNAQAQRAREGKPGADPVTPVIVKMGSGTPGDRAVDPNNSISIDSASVPFKDSTGTSWTEAISTSAGRIQSVTLQDGGLKPVSWGIVPQPGLLTSLKLLTPAGTEMLSLREVQEADNSTRLKISSSHVDFKVIGGGSGQSWNRSEARFDSGLITAIFSQHRVHREQDELTVEYQFNFPAIELSLLFQ